MHLSRIDVGLWYCRARLLFIPHTPFYFHQHTARVSQGMIQNNRTIDGAAVFKKAAEPMNHEMLSSLVSSVHSDEDVVRFDPKRCPWDTLRDVMYAVQNTNMNRLDICKALKALYPDEVQFRNMSIWDVEKMTQWWKDPAYPYRYRPLFCGSQSYEDIGLRLKRALSPPKTPNLLAAAPIKPLRNASPPEEFTEILLPPRHPPRHSIFTTEGSPEPEKPVTRRSGHAEAANQRAIPKARKVKTRDDLKNEATRWQPLTHSNSTRSLSARRSQDSKAFTYCGKSSWNPTKIDGASTRSHAEGDSLLDLASLPSHLPVEESSTASTLQSKAQSGKKPMKQSLVLAPPPQLTGLYSVKYSELPAKSNPKTRIENGHNPSPTYRDHNNLPNSPRRSPPSSHPAKRQALGEKPTNVWRRSVVECEQLPSINSLFPSEHWENLCLKTPTTGPHHTAGQDKHQITVADSEAYPLNIYGRQARPTLLPPLEPRTPSIPSLNSSTAVSPTSPIAGRSRMTYPATPSPNPANHPDFAVRKSYSEGTLKPIPVNHSDFGVRKRYSEGSLKFSPTSCPWHAIRDVALARDRMNLTKQQIAFLLSHRYGQAFPSLREVTIEQVQELWESSRTRMEALYTEQGCGVVEQELWNDLGSLGLV